MLWALLATVIASAILGARGGGPDVFEQVVKYYRKNIKRKVKDPGRQKAAYEQLDKFEGHVKVLKDSVLEHVQRIAVVHGHYESTLEDYRAILDSFGPALLDTQIAMVETGMAMKKALGPDYPALFKGVRKDLMKYERTQAKTEKKKARKAKRGKSDE